MLDSKSIHAPFQLWAIYTTNAPNCKEIFWQSALIKISPGWIKTSVYRVRIPDRASIRQVLSRCSGVAWVLSAWGAGTSLPSPWKLRLGAGKEHCCGAWLLLPQAPSLALVRVQHFSSRQLGQPPLSPKLKSCSEFRGGGTGSRALWWHFKGSCHQRTLKILHPRWQPPSHSPNYGPAQMW